MVEFDAKGNQKISAPSAFNPPTRNADVVFLGEVGAKGNKSNGVVCC